MQERNRNTGYVRGIVKNFFWLFLQLGVTRLFGFFITIILARYLSQADFGQYTYTISIAGIFLMLANLGIPSLILREIARQREKASTIFSMAFAAKLPLTIVMVALFVVFFLMTSSTGGRFAVIAIAGAYFIENFAVFFSTPFRAIEQMHYLAMGDFFYKVLMIGGVWTFLSFRSGLLGVGAVYMVCSTAYLIFYLILYKKHFTFTPIARGVAGLVSNLTAVVKDAAPMALGGVIMIVYINTDIILLKWLKGEVITGVYGVSYSFYLGLAMAASLLVQSVFPRISYAVHNNQSDVSEVVVRGTVKLLFVISVPISVGGILLSHQTILFFYGARYLAAIMTFKIFMAAIMLNYLNLLLGYCLFAERKQDETNAIYAVSIVINVVGNLLLIPMYSIVGAALATLLAEAAFTIIYIVRHRVFLRNFTIDWLWRIAVASAVMGLTVHGIGGHLGFLATVACGAVVYGVILVVEGTFVNEKAFLLSALRGNGTL